MPIIAESAPIVTTPEAPPTPVLLLPEDNTKAEAEAHFDWEDITDPSGVTYTLQVATKDNFAASYIVLEKTGLTDSEYAVIEGEELEPSSKEAPHYWRVKAVDGASNESEWSAVRSFYVGSSFTLPNTARNVLIGLGVAGAGFFGFWLEHGNASTRDHDPLAIFSKRLVVGRSLHHNRVVYSPYHKASLGCVGLFCWFGETHLPSRGWTREQRHRRDRGSHWCSFV